MTSVSTRHLHVDFHPQFSGGVKQ